MKFNKLIALTVTTFAVSSVFAAVPNTASNPKTFLGPTVHLGVVKSITDETAFALGGDVGVKNLRASGTLGWQFDYHNRVKGTLEYLQQQLTYSFFTGTEDVWMKQGAVGLNYQYNFRQVDSYNTLLDLTGYYAHSPSKNLGVQTGTYIVNGVTQNYTDYQRIAGADAFGVSPGVTIENTYGTRAGLELNYDNVQYDNQYTSGNSSKGFGGTLRLNQAVTDNIGLGASAAVRQPFNVYGANVTYSNLEYYGTWALSGFGEYSIGKNGQPTTYNVGLGADYFIDAHNDVPPPAQPTAKAQKYKDYKDYKDFKDMSLVWEDPDAVDKDLLNWVSVPAIKIPNVYGVPDENVVIQQCVVPTFTGTIPDESPGGDLVIDLSTYFGGVDGAIYSVTKDGVPMTPSQFTVSGNTLTIYYPSPSPLDPETFIITATTPCGSVPSNSFEIAWD